MSWIKGVFSSSGPPELPEVFIDNPHLSEEQIERKLRSEKHLHSQGVRINPHLPCVESAKETATPKPVEVYRRFVALTLVATCAAERAQGDPEGDIDALIENIISQRDAWDWFTERERTYLKSREANPHEDLQLSWRYEAAWPLYWALGKGPSSLDAPVMECDVSLLTIAARDDTALAEAGLRDTSAILDEADRIYRYHWAVRQSSLDGKAPGGNIDPGIVMERHHALNWLTCYSDVDWEDVTTDT